MKNTYTNIEQLPIMLNADEVARVLRISRANAYVLLHSQSVNCVRIGKRMLLPKTELIRFLKEGVQTV